MLKLATPSQYELSIEGINILRPLKLIDARKIDIASPVLDVSPPAKTSPVVGKLAKCDGTGSLLKTKNVSYDNYEYLEMGFDYTDAYKVIVFAQKVFQIYVYCQYTDFQPTMWWTDPTYTNLYFPISYTYKGMMPFVGQTMYLVCNVPLGKVCIFVFYGFY